MMPLSVMLRTWIAGFRARKRAHKVAGALCQQLRPDDPILATVICANEADRYIVRVFCGHRTEARIDRHPGWRECLIISVKKGSDVVELITDDAKYRPTIM
jgi:hypothetical protein